MDTPSIDYIQGAIEALLFINEKPLSLEQIRNVLDNVGTSDIKNCIKNLRIEYDEATRGMMIVEIAGGYQMLSRPAYASYIRDFFKQRIKEKLSRPSLETLAIIAYKQPVSRADIELIRGVNSDGVVVHLLNKGLVKVVGRKDVPGRPYLYGTTKQFLEYFGLKSLKDLPKLDDFPALLTKNNEEKILSVETQVDEKKEEKESSQEASSKQEVSEETEPKKEDVSTDNKMVNSGL